MIHLILFNLGAPADLAGGEYCVVADQGVPQQPETVTLSCPICSTRHVISETHTIADSGKVSPAFKCPSCPMLEWLRLCDWDVTR